MKISLRTVLHRLKQLQGTPTALARGTAIGVFIGIAPLLPLKSVCIVALTMIARCSTVAALLVCTIICNPLTYIPLYYLAWVVGDLLLPGRLSWVSLQTTVSQLQEVSFLQAFRLAAAVGMEAGMVLLAGGFLVALPCACASYPFAMRFFRRIERVRADKHLLNARRGHSNGEH